MTLRTSTLTKGLVVAAAFAFSTMAFAQDSAVVEPTVENGDINGSGAIDITDVIRLVNWLFLGGEEPVAAACEVQGEPSASEAFEPSMRNGDLDGDGDIVITDVLRMVNYLYLGGTAPEPIVCQQASGAEEG